MIRLMFAGLILLGAVLQSAAQVTQIETKNLNGWQVGKTDGQCLAIHSNTDQNDDNAVRVIVFGVKEPSNEAPFVLLLLRYTKWNHDGDREADLLFDNRRFSTRVKWEMDSKNTLLAEFTEIKRVIDALSQANQIVLQFGPTTRTVFKMPNASQAIGALEDCCRQ